MSLRKSPTLTPARAEANRRNASKSTGPRTTRGKSQSSMNSLRTGTRSAVYQNFFELMLDAPPCKVDLMAQALLSPAQAAHPYLARLFRCFAGPKAGRRRCASSCRQRCAERRKNPPENPRAKPECY